MPSSLSIIIPVHNEEENIGPLFNEIRKVCLTHHIDHEIIFINDGSTDRTGAILQNLLNSNDTLIVITLQKKSGQGMATFKGIERASKPYIAFLDGDLQNNPNDLPAMLELAKNYDAVLGYRNERKDNVWKRISSAIGNAFVRQLFSINIHDTGCSLRVGKTEIFKNIPYFKNYHRYLNIIVVKQHWKTIDFATNHRPRNKGKGKHSGLKFIRIIPELYSLKMRLKTGDIAGFKRMDNRQ